ncbi:MAG TPA: cytochrome c biogenesis protein ResB [Jatrophihabitantaceae bacterium]|nr:cytochrome c biogenesis protein ResB [Jatrophihabitantaceae bacterium]
MTIASAVRPARIAWRRLTSMRTALVLLFLLAVAAVPGSLLPQRPLNPDKTNAYITSHGGWGRFLDRLGMFDVFGSVWFAAIYLLLFVSLVGCLVPRIRQHARASIRKPLPAPRNLDRLPESGRFETAAAPDAASATLRTELGRRWRVTRREEPGGVVTLSAEKGYSRETGNLIFHIALLASLVLIAIGRLYSYQGSEIVVQGTGFCNVPGLLDSWKPGRLAAEGKVLPPSFCVDELTNFTAKYSDSGEPTKFAADITYTPSSGGAQKSARVTVNHPLRLEGDRLYLIGHGFAPKITVRMPNGTVRHDTAAFIPTEATTLLSEGAFKEQGGPVGTSKDVGISGFFAPSPVLNADGTIGSASPEVKDPVLGVFVYLGSLNSNGLPQSVYSLDTSKMTKIGAANLRVGQTETFSNGVAVTFDGWAPWVSMQVSHDPAQGWLLISATAMVVGLLGSLGVRRRRIWLRLTPSSHGADGSPTVVSVGGLARSDSGHFPTEFAGLFDRLRQSLHPAAERVGAGRE